MSLNFESMLKGLELLKSEFSTSENHLILFKTCFDVAIPQMIASFGSLEILKPPHFKTKFMEYLPRGKLSITWNAVAEANLYEIQMSQNSIEEKKTN